MNDLRKRIVLATGGTGGHVFPALALANELKVQQYDVVIFSDGRGHTFSKTYPLVTIPSCQIKGTLLERLSGYVILFYGCLVAAYQLHRLKPQAVVGFGGYASFPTMLAAALLRYPTIIHQADAFFGRTNRFLARWMTRIATSFPYVENIPAPCQSKVSFTGLPVRPGIKEAVYMPSNNQEPFHLLVTGGSQGAKIFSDIIPEAVKKLDPSLQKRLHISQQCRPEFLETTKARYEQTKARVTLSPFLENMGEHYEKSHLIISRAGASSVTEASVIGRPAIFIPYPFAMDNHQFYNARQATRVKGGWLMIEKELSSNKLAEYLTDLMNSPEKLKAAAANIRGVAQRDAALRLAHLVKLIAV